MRVSKYLLVAALLMNCMPAYADDDWRDDNPNQPNGYEASMLRYHYGTPGGDEPANGYAASSFRSNHGLDCYLPPEDGGPDSGWGGGGGGGGSDSGRWGADGSIMKMHFRHGMQEGQSYWNQRMQSRLNNTNQIRPNFNQAQGGFGGASSPQGQGSSFSNGMNGFNRNGMYGGAQGGGNFGRNSATGYGASSYGFGGTPYGASFQNGGGPFHSAQSNQAGQYPSLSHLQHLNLNNPQGNFQSYSNYASGNHQYAPSNGTYSNHYGNSTALQSAVNQRPLATLLRNSRGGFNQIYAP